MPRRAMNVNMTVGAVLAAAVFAAGAARGEVSTNELAKMVAEDVNRPVRPGTETGYFWNEIEKAFMYPPAFGFEKTKADVYRYTLIDDKHAQHVFFAATPQESLKSVWPDVPVGMCTLVVDAVDAQTNSLGIVGTRTFWKRAAFKPGAYPSAKRPYGEAAVMYYAYLAKAPFVRYLVEHGVTDPTYLNNSYPTKMNAAIVQAMVHYAQLRPDCAAEALKTARAAADYLLACTEKPGTPLAGLPPTYETRPELKTQAAKWYEGQMMMVYPATAAEAYLELFEATEDRKYRDAAVTIADVYLRMQGEDGTWPLMVYLKDGSPRSEHRLCPVLIAGFLERVAALTGEGKYRDAADRAIAWEDAGPMKTFNWNGQFEDAGVQPKPYWNLSKHMSGDYAIFLIDRFPGDAKRIADARELLRFGEDLFVYWERPARDDGTCIPQYPKHFNGQLNFMNWCVLPGVGEQHGWNVPIDASAAKMIRTYLALYRATKNPLDLAKAKALGDAVTRAQFDSGDIPTHWTVRHLASQAKGRGGWLNCGVATAKALEELAAAVGER